MKLTLPPLRERRGDIELLINHFLGQNWTISPDTREAMQRYDWPGNVRQLINVIERATILAEDGCVQLEDLPREVTGSSDSNEPATVASVLSGTEKLEDLERAHVLQVLHSHDGNKAQTARALGIHRRKLYRLLERFDISPSEYA